MEELADKLYNWIGEENLRYFKHLKGLTGEYAPVLKLNQKRKGIPVHPIHLREGMQIRNFLRENDNHQIINNHDDEWQNVIDLAIKKYNI